MGTKIISALPDRRHTRDIDPSCTLAIFPQASKRRFSETKFVNSRSSIVTGLDLVLTKIELSSLSGIYAKYPMLF